MGFSVGIRNPDSAQESLLFAQSVTWMPPHPSVAVSWLLPYIVAVCVYPPSVWCLMPEYQKPQPDIIKGAARAMKHPETVTVREAQRMAARLMDDQKNDPEPHQPGRSRTRARAAEVLYPTHSKRSR